MFSPTLANAMVAGVCVLHLTAPSQYAAANSEKVLNFSYVEITNSEIQSTHDIKVSLKIPYGFKQLGQVSYQAVFNDHPFNVSFAALTQEDRFIGVHAETVTDKSGYLDYSYLPSARFSGIDFFLKEQCVSIPESVVNQAHDLKHLKVNGFNFRFPLYMTQYFLNSDDGNAEYVLTLAKQVKDCSATTVTEEFKANTKHEFAQMVELRK